ncbi:RloB domain-containing protein [Carnobacterium iners]|uniref:RloB domain-containing protein n=1 Tax=Carnobacterium iners TaxID=1073423 RepID=UPI000A1CA446
MDICGLGKETLRVIEEIEDVRRHAPIIYEHTWAVFDKDDFPNDHFDNAITKAEAHNIKTAWSNESFELWYCLHFSLQQSALSREAYNASLDNLLKAKGYSGYSKIDSGIYPILRPYMDTAIKNAKKLDTRYTDLTYSKRNPCTKVYKLVEELKEIIDK